MKRRTYPNFKSITSPLNQFLATMGAVSLGGCLLILLLLSKLFKEVWEKEAFQFDTTILEWIHQYANPFLDNTMLIITRVGDPGTVIGVVFGVLLWLRLKRHYLEIKWFAIACGGALILNEGLKRFFAKHRPELWSRSIVEHSFSFPSGHALGSLLLYGFLAYLLAAHFPKYYRLIYPIAILLILAIGFSRLYLGVHWPTDVVAGYGVGFLWLMICITLLRLQQNRQEEDKPAPI